jgi:hypothetical protein
MLSPNFCVPYFFQIYLLRSIRIYLYGQVVSQAKDWKFCAPKLRQQHGSASYQQELE